VLIFRDYQKITQALLWLSLPLFVYVAAAIVTGPRLGVLVWYSFIPHVTRDSAYVTAIIGVFGSLLTPYILVWQTSSRREQVQFAAVAHGPESHTGTAVTTLLSYSIIVAAASVLHSPNAGDMTTRLAAEALRPAVGDFGPIVFAVGIIGAGLVALPVLVASMCYSVAESLGWRSGLSERPWEATRFYVLISAAVFLAAALNFMRVNPVTALYLSMVLAGVLAVPILLAILVLSNDRRIMRTTNSRSENFWIGACAGALCSAELIWLFWKLF
jgi:Mn2+/Fe2+ NRAMP family transporter